MSDISSENPTVYERWFSEKTAAWLSRAVAEAEADPAKAALFGKMSEAAEEQAAIIADELGAGVADYRPPFRAHVIRFLVRVFGPRAARPILTAAKVRGVSVYRSGTPLAHPMPTSVEEVGQRHRGTGGGALRAAVFGVNDGLVSNTCLVMGVAGAGIEPRMIIVTGVAGLLAGAFSMAAGEYISMRSQREMFEYQIAEERDELERYPEEEAEELALIYHARGLGLDDARKMAIDLIRQPEKALDALTREELGLNPDDLGSPWGAAIWSFLAFGIGAVLPLLPFVVGMRTGNVMTAGVISGAALFLVGSVLSLYSGRSGFYGGARMVVIGGLAAAATFAIGTLFDVAVG